MPPLKWLAYLWRRRYITTPLNSQAPTSSNTPIGSQRLLLTLRDESPQANAYFKEALALAREIKHPWLIAYALTRWGDFQLYQEQFQAAKEAFEEALEIARALGAQELEGRALLGVQGLPCLKGVHQ